MPASDDRVAFALNDDGIRRLNLGFTKLRQQLSGIESLTPAESTTLIRQSRVLQDLLNTLSAEAARQRRGFLAFELPRRIQPIKVWLDAVTESCDNTLATFQSIGERLDTYTQDLTEVKVMFGQL